jgi:type III secretion protein J
MVRSWVKSVRALLVVLTVSAASACSAPVARGLEEADANAVVVALEEGGIVADKEPDPEAEGRWRINVSREEAASAAAILSEANLPPRTSPGVLEALGGGSLVPSRTSEHAKLISGTSGELERSLRSVEGVLSARVHLGVPAKDALVPADRAEPPTASVLIRHRGPNAPVSVQDVQRLVAGAVPGLDPTHVSVVSKPSIAAERSPTRDLVRFGPLTVTRASLWPLRAIVGAAALLNIVLIAVVGFAWRRARRAELALEDQRNASQSV